jgi:hypothetical protein
MRNDPDKVVEKIKTHILGSVHFFLENLAIYEVMWTNMAQPDRPQMSTAHSHCMLDKQD